MDFQSVRATRAAQMVVITDTGGPYDGCKVKLIGSDFAYSYRMVIGDLDFLTAAGLGVQTVGTFSAPYDSPEGVMKVTAPSLTFVVTALPAELSCYGWALLDTAAAVLLGVVKFDSPVPITNVGDGVLVDVTIPYGA